MSNNIGLALLFAAICAPAVAGLILRARLRAKGYERK